MGQVMRKRVLCHMRTTHPRSLISTFVVRCLHSVICILAISRQSFTILASFCGWASWFESYLVENPRRHVLAWCGSNNGNQNSWSQFGCVIKMHCSRDSAEPQRSKRGFHRTDKQTEPCRKIMAHFVLRKLILQTRMSSHPAAIQWGLDVWFLVGPFVYFHTSCVRTEKALARLRGCAGSPEPSLVAFVISTIISWAGSIVVVYSDEVCVIVAPALALCNEGVQGSNFSVVCTNQFLGIYRVPKDRAPI